jgi:hypothetical protein
MIILPVGGFFNSPSVVHEKYLEELLETYVLYFFSAVCLIGLEVHGDPIHTYFFL